jgi:hypothetical protein
MRFVKSRWKPEEYMRDIAPDIRAKFIARRPTEAATRTITGPLVRTVWAFLHALAYCLTLNGLGSRLHQ